MVIEGDWYGLMMVGQQACKCMVVLSREVVASSHGCLHSSKRGCARSPSGIVESTIGSLLVCNNED